MNNKTKARRPAKKTARGVSQKRSSVGASILKGLEEAVARTREDDKVRVTLVHAPETDVSEVRTRMGLSQVRFATKFGIPPGTLRH